MNTATKRKNVTDIQALVAAGTLVKLHSSLFRGYVSRVDEEWVESYKGRFGEGYTVRSPNWDSTGYSWITYYVYKQAI